MMLGTIAGVTNNRTMTNEVVLEARGLARKFGRKSALNNFNLTLKRGEAVALLGLNGAGKSTALNLIAGALQADQGSIAVCGYDTRSDAARARSQLGFLPQRPPLCGDMQVASYLRFCAELHGIPDVSGAVDAACSMCKLSEVRERRIAHLSQGYQQRIGIAQAIVHRPALVVLDEPTNSLDPAQINQVRGLISQLSENAAVLLSTHILPEVRQFASRVAILHDGQLVHDSALGETGSRVRVRFDDSVPAQELAAVAGVTVIAQEDDNRWTLDLEDQTSSQFVEYAVGAGWALSEMQPDHDGLEQRFLAVTRSDPLDIPDN